MEKEKRQQLIAKICCVLAAFSLWLYISNVQNPIITRTIKRVPVELENVDTLSQHNLVATVKTGYNVDVTIKGKTSDVNSIEKQELKLIANLGEYAVKAGENKIPVEVKQIPENVTIVDSGNLWVNIALNNIVDKKFPININTTGKIAEGYEVGEIKLDTKEVTVDGADNFVNNIDEIGCDVDLDGLTETKDIDCKLKALDSSGKIIEGVTINPDSVSVHIPINKVKTVPLKVATQNSSPEGVTIKSITSNITEVKITGDDNVVKAMENITTEPIDLSQIKDTTSRDVKLIIPDGVKILNDIKSVNTKITVEKAEVNKPEIQKTIEAKIETKNLGNGLVVTIDKNQVSLVFQGEEKNVNAIIQNNLVSPIDLSGKEEGEYTVDLTINTPSGVKLQSQSIKSVKITIKKKPVEGTNDNTNQ